MLYGANPVEELTSKFVVAEESNTRDISEITNQFEIIDLKGHTTNQIGIKTSDGVWFIGDALVGQNIIEKYKVLYLYNIDEYLKTLDLLENLDGNLFIASHAQALEDIHDLIDINRKNIFMIINLIKNICKKDTTFEEIVKDVFDEFNLKMDINQNVLVGSTIKSILTYMREQKIVDFTINNNMIYWKTI